jgi:gamma-glutamyltranspeptidase/glutathione hydrolase
MQPDTNRRAGPPLARAHLAHRNRDRSTVVARNGMVCASQPLAAQVGLDALKAGGTCVDAAIAANAALGVMEPQSCGIGGDLFAIVWHERDGRLYGLNASGRAPAAWDLARATQLSLEAIPARSPLSWTVPGCVDAWQRLSDRFGRLTLARVLAPAIEYARYGFPLSPLIAAEFDFDPRHMPDLAAVYHPAGRTPRYGDVFHNPLLARCYELIATDGAAAFYDGEIAARIEAKSTQLGGCMSRDDLRDHSGDWVDPVCASYRDHEIWQLPPNGQGLATLQILNLMELFDATRFGHNSVDQLHLFIEAKKLVYEDRARYYADPVHAEVPLAWLISKEYARERARLIDPARASDRVRGGTQEPGADTVYLCAADDAGNMISLIQSIYSSFGSTICPDGLGFAMQNRGQAFSLDPMHPNRLAPRKRPFHTVIPAFVTRADAPVMAFGVMGGDFQPQGQAQVLMNMLDFGMSPQQATDVPRIAHLGSSTPWGGVMSDGGIVNPEPGFDARVLSGLAERGHRIDTAERTHGGYQAIWRAASPRRYFGGSDPRKDGQAVGY